MNDKYRLGALKIERNVLQAELSEDELWENERYQRLEQLIQQLEEEVDEDEEWEKIEN